MTILKPLEMVRNTIITFFFFSVTNREKNSNTLHYVLEKENNFCFDFFQNVLSGQEALSNRGKKPMVGELPHGQRRVAPCMGQKGKNKKNLSRTVVFCCFFLSANVCDIL